MTFLMVKDWLDHLSQFDESLSLSLDARCQCGEVIDVKVWRSVLKGTYIMCVKVRLSSFPCNVCYICIVVINNNCIVVINNNLRARMLFSVLNL